MTPWFRKIKVLLALIMALELVLPSHLGIIDPPTYASTFQSGYQKYQVANFKGAEADFARAVTKARGAQKAKILKFLGICQFMLGKKSQAAQSFKLAKSIVPSLRISDSEVLDESVIPFFKAQRGRKIAKTPAPRTQSSSRASVLPAKRAKSTLLQIQSNVPGASVFIDAILAGQVNTQIETDPGKINLQVTAPGYLKISKVVNIRQNQINTIAVTLVKPKPKPKPKPKVRPKPVAAAKPRARPARPGTPPATKANPVYMPKSDDMFAKDLEGEDNLPVRNLEDEFNRATSPTYQQPQQRGYYQQPQQPGYYQAPPPGYYQQPPPGYYGQPQQPPPAPPQPIAPASQPVAPVSPAQPPPPPDPVYADPAGPVDPPPRRKRSPRRRSGKSKSARSSSSGDRNIFIALLPFGAGQFQNDKPIFGSLFAASELGALFAWYYYGQQADKVVEETNAWIRANPNSGQQDWINQRKAYAADLRQKSDYGLYGFVALWAVGAIEAIVNEPAPPRKKKRRRKKYNGFSLLTEETETKIAALDHNQIKQTVEWKLLTPWTPTPGSDKTRLNPPHGQTQGERVDGEKYGIGLRWTF